MTTTITIQATAMTDRIKALLRLQTWLSPAFPTGSFSYSHGLETAIAGQVVCDKQSTRDWIKALLHQGSGWNDALFFVAGWKAGSVVDETEIENINDLCLALQPSRERWLETTLQGQAFYDAARSWPNPLLHKLKATDIALPVIAGALFGASDIPLKDALAAYLNAFVSNLVWICVRLIPLGQKDALSIIAELETEIIELAQQASRSTLDDLGSCAFVSDIASMAHENLETRICRS